jgi:hypothetical protein
MNKLLDSVSQTFSQFLLITLYTYISMIHYKLLILILLIWKYATSSHAISSFFIEKYF